MNFKNKFLESYTSRSIFSFGLSIAFTLPSVLAHDVGGKHDHPGNARIQKPRIDDTIRANIYADNWFVLYINGQIAAIDSIPFIPHNVISVDLLPEYPMTIAIMARDNADPQTGMEYSNTNIGDGGFILKFSDGTVTNSNWKAKNFFHGPINSDQTNPEVRKTEIPNDWFAIDFDDSDWNAAKEFTEKEISPKEPYFENDFEGAKWIWSDDLKLDNTVIFRYRVETPPNGKEANPDWPRGHITPSAANNPPSDELDNEQHANSSLDTSVPYQARAFAPFAEDLAIRWDEQFVYIGSNSIPDHPMMTGITAWNQQVPLPQNYVADNAWKLPLYPKKSDNPISAKTSLFKGAIAVAINGVPIFNPIKQDGVTDTNLAGELDQFGGHAGRADDYHYHLAPTFLNELVGEQQPIGFAMDGYPLYGYNEIDGTPAENLDIYNGHEHGDAGYHYHSTKNYPYLNGGLRGETAIKDGQVAIQPRAQGVRPFTRPLRGATITSYEKLGATAYSLTYSLNEKNYSITVSYHPDGSAQFVFTHPDGTVKEELYQPKP